MISSQTVAPHSRSTTLLPETVTVIQSRRCDGDQSSQQVINRRHPQPFLSSGNRADIPSSHRPIPAGLPKSSPTPACGSLHHTVPSGRSPPASPHSQPPPRQSHTPGMSDPDDHHPDRHSIPEYARNPLDVVAITETVRPSRPGHMSNCFGRNHAQTGCGTLTNFNHNV